MVGSYFSNAVAGNFGKAIQKMYQKDAENLLHNAETNAYVDRDGAIFWNTNGHYLPDDACEMLEYEGYSFSREVTARKRKIQEDAEIEEYMKRDHQFSDEELVELKANFPGQKIVDVITGETIQL